MNTFIAKILSLFFCCFALGNVFAQDEVTYKGKLEDKTTNQMLSFNDFIITVIETGEKVKVDSLGQFKFTLPKECNDVNLSFQENDKENQNKYIRNIEENCFVIVQQFDDKLELFNRCYIEGRGTRCGGGIVRITIPRKSRYLPSVFFNKTMGM